MLVNNAGIDFLGAEFALEGITEALWQEHGEDRIEQYRRHIREETGERQIACASRHSRKCSLHEFIPIIGSDTAFEVMIGRNAHRLAFHWNRESVAVRHGVRRL